MWVLGNPAQLSSHAEAFLAYTGLSLPQHPKLLLVENSRGLSYITTCARCPKSLRHWSAQFSAFKRWTHLSLCSYGGLLPVPFLKRIGRIHPYMGWINHKSRKRFNLFFLCFWGFNNLLLQVCFVCSSFRCKARLLIWACPRTAPGLHFKACFSYSPLENILLRAVVIWFRYSLGHKLLGVRGILLTLDPFTLPLRTCIVFHTALSHHYWKWQFCCFYLILSCIDREELVRVERPCLFFFLFWQDQFVL